MLNRSLSVAQNIDELFFSSSAPLRSEYGFLFKSLFKESTLYRRVVETLAKKLKGMTRPELIEELKVEDSGYVSTVLSDLCNCDFIRKYSAFGKTDRDFMYQLTDLYSLFYLKYVKNYHGEDEHYWSHRQMDISVGRAMLSSRFVCIIFLKSRGSWELVAFCRISARGRAVLLRMQRAISNQEHR